jgi:diguanylate cyclase (GGDEF)-like protein
MHLREHEKLQYLLAYLDSMTGLRNTTSYKVWVTDFDKDIQTQSKDFGVIVLDINYLKETNDKYGHDVGNKLIVAVAQIISGIFKRSPVFRIGGDEFLVILQNRDLENFAQLCESFDLECANSSIVADEDTIPISVAKGFAKYDPTADTQFVDVFNRADDAMYKNKRKMK